MRTKTNYSLKFMALLMLGLSTVLTFSSCKDDDDDSTPAPIGSGNLMVIHASPDAPAVDLLLDGTKINTADVVYTDNTAYFSVTSGTRTLKVNVAGTATTALQASLPIVKNKNYSVFAIDSVSKISGLFIEDDLTAPAAGKAHVRFIHLSPDAPAVDVAVTGGPVVFGNKSFKEFTNFTPLDAMTYNLEVRLAGTSTVVLPLPGIALTAGKIYTVYAKGFVGGAGVQALGAEIIVNN
jgi:hypothetical protein